MDVITQSGEVDTVNTTRISDHQKPIRLQKTEDFLREQTERTGRIMEILNEISSSILPSGIHGNINALTVTVPWEESL